MTPLDAMKNVMGFLEDEYPSTPMTVKFRNAIAEMESAEPVAWHGVTGDYGYHFLSFQEQPGMTPVYEYPMNTATNLRAAIDEAIAKVGAGKTGEGS